MNLAHTGYFHELTAGIGQSWNRFWFTPADAVPLCVLRIGVGLMAMAFFLSFSDLTRWFAADGLLPTSSVQLLLASPDSSNYHVSILNYFRSPAELWTIHVVAIAASAMLTAGLFTRLSTILTLAALLSYIHRAPMITGHQEPILAMLLFYLCFAPAGRYLSFDAFWRRLRNRNASEVTPVNNPPLSLAAAVPLRLIQVHLAAFYVMLALTKISGPAWWNGDAVWYLMAQTHSRPVDISGLRSNLFLINAWTHSIVIYELLFPVLIWNRLARPLLLAVGIVMWLSLALVTGLTMFCLTMLVANIAFISPELLRRLCGNCACVEGN